MKIHNTSIKKPLIENKDAELKLFNIEKAKFHLDFKVYGRSIFQNFLLTANAYSSKNSTDPIPIKCTWKRIKNDTQVFITDINSNSYIPTGEDIGYIIECEITPLDKIFGTHPIIAQYGPLQLNEDTKQSLEMILSQGGTKFQFYMYNLEEQSKSIDREIEIVLESNEFKLMEKLRDGSSNIVEYLRYHPNNPIIKLHTKDSTRLSLRFFESSFDYEDTLSKNFKNEYNLVAMSKSQREMFYLVFHCLLIDEKVKNKKLFHALNYKLLPEEMKNGVTDLITEIKTLREENNILLNNAKFYEKENTFLRTELKDLEDDFRITLEHINNPDHEIMNDVQNRKNTKSTINNDNNLYGQIKPEMSETINLSNKSQTINYSNKTPNNTNNYFDLNKKIDELTVQYSSLVSTEKALREEVKGGQLQLQLCKSQLNQANRELESIKEKLAKSMDENQSLIKSNNFLSEMNNKLSKENNNFINMKIELEAEKSWNQKVLKKKEEQIDNDITDLKKQNDELIGINENLTYENKNLKVQNNMYKNQKETITKEFERIKTEKELLKERLNKIEDEFKILKSKFDEKEALVISLNELNEKARKENKSLHEKCNQLEELQNVLQDANRHIGNNTTILDESIYKIGREEYEEFDNFKKEKDEIECNILFLKSNNEAQKMEIENLRRQIDDLKKSQAN